MNKQDLIVAISDECGYTKTSTEEMLNAFIKIVKNSVASGEDVRLVGFGTFTTLERKERKCKNPQTGEIMTVAAKKAPKFIPGDAFKKIVL